MLVLHNVNTYYGGSHVLQDVSMEVKEKEFVVLLGRNGAGKTTTLKSIMGIQRPRKGTIRFLGEDTVKLRPYEIARKGISLVPEDRCIIPNLSLFENLKLAMLSHIKKEDRDRSLEEVIGYLPWLKERLQQRGDTLSGGEQQMLAIARGVITNPRLLMVDEPTEGVAPILVVQIGNILKTLSQKGVAILLVEQNYEMSLDIVLEERAYIIEKGNIRISGTPEELRTRQTEVESYLGVKI